MLGIPEWDHTVPSHEAHICLSLIIWYIVNSYLNFVKVLKLRGLFLEYMAMVI